MLSTLLKSAVAWKAIERLPCRIELLRVPAADWQFYDEANLDLLRGAARDLDARLEIGILLGADAGRHRGEVIALEWADLDVRRGEHRMMHVRRADWDGHVSLPKRTRLAGCRSPGGSPRPLRRRAGPGGPHHRGIPPA